jgi:hypothetical protein
VRFIQHNHGILIEIRVSKAFSLEHAVRHVLDPRLWACEILETDRVANLLAERAADLLCDTFCDGHSSDATGLCTTYYAAVCVSVFGKILSHLSRLSSSCVPDNDEDLVLSGSQQEYDHVEQYLNVRL